MEQKKTHTEEDEMMQNLFQSFETEKPSDSFTKNTMSQVLHEWSSQPISTKANISYSNKIIIGITIACCLVLIYLIDVKNVFSSASLIQNLKDSLSLNITDSLIHPVKTLMIKIPTIVYIISFSSAVILCLDKLLRKTSGNLQTK